MPIEKRHVTFQSGETFAAAWLFFLPPRAWTGAKVPAVGMAHGACFAERLGRPTALEAASPR